MALSGWKTGWVALASSGLALVGCNDRLTQKEAGAEATTAATPTTVTAAPTTGPPGDLLAAQDAAPTGSASQPFADAEVRPMMQLQVLLDRLGFAPGVVDGRMGLSTHNALAGFQEANGLTVTGESDTATQRALRQWQAGRPAISATRVVTIPADFAAGPFVTIPTRPDEQAKLAELGYQTLDEKLAERFHTTPAVLIALNPGGRPAGAPAGMASAAASAIPTGAATAAASHFAANQQVRVPNLGNDAIVPGAVTKPDWQATLISLGVGSEQPHVAKVVVSKSGGTLKAYDGSGKLVATFTATMGSAHDPLPLGPWKIRGISHNPKFHYNPALFWDAKSGSDKATLPAGPNSPVGVVWIDISKPHYGIHGTPNPETIGRAESHGCVRLTNWDAARLAQMVSTGTELSFET